ncbi:hypothetical protein DOTSEDRAFT_73125 [Dothistroma septosporum NZE10]|uniref:F-box domain-containing protein n=1 Tax=Dothistroma septosporum (strain NZE10 / CBS 128990) TaxID=675120 RepID=N1PLP1_DOTSN|nr:hypothetical protein DOTSEDRAFT_73125 [Dothistroma septosporum NZE10]
MPEHPHMCDYTTSRRHMLDNTTEHNAERCRTSLHPESAIMQRSSILVLNDDILVLICDALRPKPSPLLEGQWRYHDPNPLAGLAALSATCKRLRDLVSPSLFRRVKLGRGHWTWDDVRRALTLPPPSRHIQHFTLDIFAHHKDHQGPEKPQPDLELAAALARFLNGLPRLQIIRFTIPDECHELFKEAFQASAIQLSTVKTLRTTWTTQWLVRHCSAVDVLAIDAATARDSGGFPEVLSQTTNLKHLELDTHWNFQDLGSIRKIAPELEVLAISRNVRPYHDAFERMIPTISTFSKLRVLALGSVDQLGVPGLSRRPRCGNAYHGPGGKALRERLANERIVASQTIATNVFGACIELRELWISDYAKYTVTRNGDGSVAHIHMSGERRPKPTEAAY